MSFNMTSTGVWYIVSEGGYLIYISFHTMLMRNVFAESSLKTMKEPYSMHEVPITAKLDPPS
jgi:hypothetical protein